MSVFHIIILNVEYMYIEVYYHYYHVHHSCTIGRTFPVKEIVEKKKKKKVFVQC